MGIYTLHGNTKAGRDFIGESVSFELWQGSANDGIAIEGTNNAQDIADAAFDEGLTVIINGRKYIGNGKLAA